MPSFASKLFEDMRLDRIISLDNRYVVRRADKDTIIGIGREGYLPN